MKISLKTLALGAAIAASSTLAYAGPITGIGVLQIQGLSLNGDTVMPTPFLAGTNSLTFTDPAGSLGLASTGDFAGASSATMATTYSFTAGGSFSNLNPLVTFTSSNGTDSFIATSETFNTLSGEIDFLGYLTGAFDVNVKGSFAIDSLQGVAGAPPGSFQAVLVIPPALGSTPEPSSLVLLGTGLVSAGGMLLRRRRVSL